MGNGKRLAAGPGRARGRAIAAPGRAAGARGVSLVETIVAIAIVVVALNILTQFVIRGMDESSLARRRARAAFYAQERLEEIVAHRADLAAWEARAARTHRPAAVEGMYWFPEPHRSAFCWSWRIEDVKGRPGLRQARVSVRWRTPRRRYWVHTAQLHTLIAVPTPRRPRIARAGAPGEGRTQP